jgi:hypothetical protein
MMATEAAVDKAADATASQSLPVCFIFSIVLSGYFLGKGFGTVLQTLTLCCLFDPTAEL